MKYENDEGYTVMLNGAIRTSDDKYVMVEDEGEYYYWHPVKRISNSIVTAGHSIGNRSYDYCFTGDPKAALKVLDRALSRYK